MKWLLRLLVAVVVSVGVLSAKLPETEAQTMQPPPGMILVDCPVRPAPWQAPSIQGHPGWDLNTDPSSAVSIARGVPAQCIDFPGGSQRVFEQMIGIKAYIPRWGTDPGSQTGALDTAVVICDLSGCSAHNAGSSPEQEWWRSGYNWREYASPNGRWLYSIRGGLDTTTCDVFDQRDWRRWLRLVHEQDLIGCLDRIWARGGTIGMPPTPTPLPTATSMPTPIPTAVPTSPPTPVPTQAVVTAPRTTPVPATADLERRITALEEDNATTRQQLDTIIDILRPAPMTEEPT